MKKIKITVIALLSTLVLGACTVNTTEPNRDYDDKGEWIYIGETLWYDKIKNKETGCIYLYNYTEEGITPFYSSNGEVMGCGTF